MKDVQEIFNQLKKCLTEQKQTREEYKDALFQAEEYEEIKDKIKELTEKRKEIEAITQSRMGSRWIKLEDLKSEITELKQAQSDIAMSNLMAGKNVRVTDEFDNIYEPQFSVTFKKTDKKKLTRKNNLSKNYK